MMSIVCYVQASALLTSFFTPIVKQDSWLIVLAGIVTALPLLFIYTALMRTFPGKNLIEMCELALGRIGGAVVSLMFIWFFITLTTVSLSSFGVFLRQTILVETPPIATKVVCMLVSAYAVWNGLKVLTRYAAVFTLIAYALTAFGIVFTFSIMDFGNFLPILAQPALNYVQSTHIMATIPFGELVAFLMVAPYVRKGKEPLRAYLIGGFLLGCITILSVVVRDTAVLGRVGLLFAQPSFETLRLINIMKSINRVELLFAIVLIILMFFKIAVLYYVSVLAVAQVLHLKSYSPLVLIIGALIVAYSVFVYPSTEVRATLGRDILPIFWLLFELVLPLLLLVVGHARGLHKPPQASASNN
jgi:spore germination protein KB